MKLIVGLGNVGRQYKDTPHNAGFEFVDALRTQLVFNGYQADAWKIENTFQSNICKVRKNGELVYLLAKPTTFMNLSGSAVSKLVEKFTPTDVVICHDDLDIKLGMYKIQIGVGPKDHNGVKSILSIKGSEKYLRVRLGVESRVDKSIMPGDIYVIKRFGSNEILTLNETIATALSELLSTINPE